MVVESSSSMDPALAILKGLCNSAAGLPVLKGLKKEAEPVLTLGPQASAPR